jgi:hypothetical protein
MRSVSRAKSADNGAVIQITGGILARLSWPLLPTLVLALSMACSGKEREFGSTSSPPLVVALPAEASGSSDGGMATIPPPNPEGSPAPGVLTPPSDAGLVQNLAPSSTDFCGDACSDQCAPGSARCASFTQRIGCGIDALWGAATSCPNV